MKQTILAVAALVVAAANGTATAQITQKLNLEKATVFLSGAQLESTARVSLSKGENEVRFTNVAGNVNKESIIVGATNGVVVESVTFQNNFLATDNLSPRAKELKDSIEIMGNQKQPVATKITVLAEQITILQANRRLAGENTGATVAELTKMLDFVKTKLEHCINEKYTYEMQLTKMDIRIGLLNRQLEEEQKKSYQPGGQVIVKFFAKESTTSGVTVSYNVPGAGWVPTYDVWADDTKSPVKIFYKANIYQNSGVKWDNIKLSLSSGNPTQGMQAPSLNPWYLAFEQPAEPMRRVLFNSAMPGSMDQQEKNLHIEDEAEDDTKAALSNSSMNSHVNVDNAGINTTFDIDLPYTIPSDGQNHLVSIKKYEAPAQYQYLAVPKADKDAFLMAQVTNWEGFNMLPGQTNIFYEGTYVGQGAIDPRNVKDTMSLSLGRDKKIVVRIERDKKQRSVKTIGTNIRETFAYNITVRNTRKETVTIIVQDQIPVSGDKDIVIEDKETSGADYNETTGLMKWAVTLKPNETKAIPFGYTLKYPKGKRLQGL